MGIKTKNALAAAGLLVVICVTAGWIYWKQFKAP